MAQTLDGIVLLGWLEKAEAVAFLQQGCWFDPQITTEAAEDLCLKYRNAVAQLPERAILKPSRLPIPGASVPWVNKFLARHKGPEVLDVINIDPRTLGIYQFYVAVDRSEHHAKSISRKQWTETCLVIDRAGAQLPIRAEDHILKVTLPHAEHMVALRPDGAFQIQQGGGYVCVCEVEGRMILKAGYHRSFAFARTLNAPEASDISLLVALTATAPAQLLPQSPAGLRTIVLGSCPPLFSDFFNDSLAMRVKLRRKRYEAHIHIEQVDDL